MTTKIKGSVNPEKITNHGVKKVVRMYDKKGRMRGDVLFRDGERIPKGRPFRVHHPIYPHVFKTYPKRFEMKELMVPIFQKGKLVYKSPSVHEIRESTLENLKQLDSAYKRFSNPHQYHISLSPSLFKIKGLLLRQTSDRT